MGVEPVARPRTQSGFVARQPAITSAAFLLMSSYVSATMKSMPFPFSCFLLLSLPLPAPPGLPTHRSEVLRHVQNWAVSMTSW